MKDWPCHWSDLTAFRLWTLNQNRPFTHRTDMADTLKQRKQKQL
jgi:hypothetical protein